MKGFASPRGVSEGAGAKTRRTERKNVGTDAVPALGARRAGNFPKRSKLGTFASPGCGVEGYCSQSPEDHAEDELFGVCCENFVNGDAQKDCLCNPIKYLI